MRFVYGEPENISLCTRCHEKPVEVESRGVCRPCYGSLRYRSSLPPKVKCGHTTQWYRDRAIKRHGPEFIADMESLRDRPLTTLQGVSAKYGITREGVRILFKRIFDMSYTQCAKAKAKRLREEVGAMGCKIDPRSKSEFYKPGSVMQATAEVRADFMKLCLEKGFDVEIPDDELSRKGIMLVNGKRVCVRMSRVPHGMKGGRAKYYGTHFYEDYQDVIDYKVLHVKPTGETYIFPKDKVGTSVYIPESKEASGNTRPGESLAEKVAPFCEAWHLLA